MGKKSILIVDDDARNIFALKATLESRGHLCHPASSAGDAIALLQREKDIDVILMDMMMPEIDGYEAIPIIRNLPGMREMPIVAVTAQAMVGDREKCLGAGADEYLSKPVDVDRLFNIIDKL